MPANSGPAERLKKLIESLSSLPSEALTSVKIALKGISVKKISCEFKRSKSSEIKLEVKKDLKVNQLKPKLNILPKKLSIPSKENSKITNYNLNKKVEKIISFPPLAIECTDKQITLKSVVAEIKNIANLIFVARLNSITNLTCKKPESKTLLLETIKKPQILDECTKFSVKISKRSESFPTNLPIEKKPVSLTNISYDDMESFKDKLAKIYKTRKSLIKITSVYSKLNINNLQNIKIDPKSGNLYCNFKPKSKMSSDDSTAYLVIGIKKDDKSTVKTMVTNAELK